MYIIIATNMYGVDEAPVLTDDKESAIEAMRELFIYGLNNQKPEILEEFATKKKIIEEFDSYEVLKRHGAADDFFEWLEYRGDTEIDDTSMQIRFSDDEADVYEVNCWEKESKKNKFEERWNMLNESFELQKQYHNMYVSNRITKKSMCDLVIPFKEKYSLTDHEALNIVKGFTSTKKIMNIAETVFP